MAVAALSGSVLLSGCGNTENPRVPEPTINPTAEQLPLAPTTVPDEDKMICPQADAAHLDCLNNPN